jgi:hypothetical protein
MIMRAGSRLLAVLAPALFVSVTAASAPGQINLKTAAALDTTRTAAPESTLAAPAPEAASSPAAAEAPSLTARVRLDLTPLSEGADREREHTFIPAQPGPVPEPSWMKPEGTGWARYNRVEGPAVFLRLERPLSRDTFMPRVVGGFGYAFAAKRGQYRLEMEQPVLPHHRVTVDVAAYRDFLPFFYQDEALSSEENTASAFFLHRDYWDWYEAEGLRGGLGVYASPFMKLSLGVVREDEASLVNHADWSVFRQTRDFLENAAIVDGQYRAYEAAATYDTRPNHGDPHGRPGWGAMENYLRVSWERAGAGLGGDYDLWRVSADLRNYFRISPRQSLATRILAGTGNDAAGILPPQKRFAVGGLGTLRGHLYRDLHGDHVALANVEYSFDLGRRSRALVFVDAGTAWDAGRLTDQRIPVDVGTGFRFGQDGITVLLAQTVNESHADPKLYLRLGESF